MRDNKAIIATTMGDPAGIGPEIVVKAMANQEIQALGNIFVIGQSDILEKAIEVTNSKIKLRQIDHPSEARFEYGQMDVLNLETVDMPSLRYGEVQASCGQAAYTYIKKAVELANEGQINVIATAPINKESLKAAEVPHIGHTEMLANMTGTNDPLTMFEVHSSRIFFLTRHLSLKDAIAQMTADRVHDYLLRCDQALQQLGVDSRKIAVAGLNPHSGENGLFGMEEVNEISPGIERAREDGIAAVGPVPADSVFHQALQGKYDAVLSLYHDQGHIAAKMTDFERTISITNGLPFLRTSVDHGTAFDIAGTGEASAVSMEECLEISAKYAKYFTNV
ncbi:4-hydroxythreonine-4-phosphate dehydrogenase PdxA [Salicibibacter cibarius]|uniref:4-hydroxythreonine-4-phosphate dehydrogenase PdxA n=1 Tax=Salicibibacter cibarius TaxID=2743000 RepID=A0A7T7CAE2_9BACI|nr:4-hydroxythreonine-4-phosphate dehydrogenase PdxA [Salicibibacter cibarius]QQK74807.1 4-hydroxythreonine-4-phosphate dehydrogenase PdxA [Salicibibacter cibarius]